MARSVWALAAAALALGCLMDEGDDSAACAELDPCGGELSGDWIIASFCEADVKDFPSSIFGDEEACADADLTVRVAAAEAKESLDAGASDSFWLIVMR